MNVVDGADVADEEARFDFGQARGNINP